MVIVEPWDVAKVVNLIGNLCISLTILRKQHKHTFIDSLASSWNWNLFRFSLLFITGGGNRSTRQKHRLTRSHWRLSHMPRVGFKPGQWWETASSQWQCKLDHTAIRAGPSLAWSHINVCCFAMSVSTTGIWLESENGGFHYFQYLD